MPVVGPRLDVIKRCGGARICPGVVLSSVRAACLAHGDERPGIDWDWATRTGGALSASQRRQLLTSLLRTVVRYPAARLRIALGRRGSGRLDLGALRWPDSQLARDAEAEAREALSPHVLEHSYRTYLFGLVLASIDTVRVDEELAYVSSVLHDLQLEHPTSGRCFAVVGGERAERFALERGADPVRAAAIGAAIAGHITPEPPSTSPTCPGSSPPERSSTSPAAA